MTTPYERDLDTRNEVIRAPQDAHTSLVEGRRDDAVVAIYESHSAAETAVKALHAVGIDMSRLSVIGQNFHTEEHAVGLYSSGDRMKFWNGRGVFWGGLREVLFGSAFFFIPVLGPVAVMGPLVGWIVGVLEGEAQSEAQGGDMGILAAALTSIGIPEKSVVKYELEVKAGRFLVLARGSADMTEQARVVLLTTSPLQLVAHIS